MEIGQIKAFCKVAELKSFVEAANALYITQPAVSLKIKKLEESLNANLLIRNNRSVKLSHEGEVFLPFAINLLKTVTEAKFALDDVDQLKRGHIVIGCSDTLAKYVLLSKIKPFVDRYPDIEITILNKTSSEIKKLFGQGLIDIAFLLDDGNSTKGEVSIDWLQYLDCVALAKDHALASRKIINLQSITDHKLILLENSSTSRNLFNISCLIAGANPQNIIEAGSVEMQKDMARIGLGLAIVPDFVFEAGNNDTKGLVKVKLSGMKTRNIKMFTQNYSKAGDALVEHFNKDRF